MPHKQTRKKTDNLDLFYCDLVDVAFKDDMAGMEYPIFSISKNPIKRTIRYDSPNNDNWIEILPSHLGIATIWDKDLLSFAISQIVAAKEAGKPYSKHIRFTAYDFLQFSRRSKGGKDYRSLEDSLDRLVGTRLKTNIKTGEIVQTNSFGLIDKYEIVRTERKLKNKPRILVWGVTLSDWLMNAIEGNEVLTKNPDYFDLTGGLERRLSDIARKHCGAKKRWKIGLDLLHKKSGAQCTIYSFKEQLAKLVKKNSTILDHRIMLTYEEVEGKKKPRIDVVFIRVGKTGKKPSYVMTTKDKSKLSISNNTIENCKKLCTNARLDVYALEDEWRYSIAKIEKEITNPDGHFTGFVKKKCKDAMGDNQGILF